MYRLNIKETPRFIKLVLINLQAEAYRENARYRSFKKYRFEDTEKRKDNINRTIQSLTDYMDCNYIEGKTLFTTLTYKKDIKDRKKALKDFNNFIYKLKLELKQDIKYICVDELQKKRGVIHFHIVLFDIGYLSNKFIADIWGKGFVNIKKLDYQNGKAIHYLTKYLTKDRGGYNQKYYRTSQNLKKPTIKKVTNHFESIFLYDNLIKLNKDCLLKSYCHLDYKIEVSIFNNNYFLNIDNIV